MACYVLVHGAWSGGAGYAETAAILRARGHEAHVAQMTGIGPRNHLLSPAIDLSTHIQDVVALVEDGSLDDIILVGHSYGGMVITGVAARIGARIRTLVYLDAFLPGDGESLWDIAGERARKHYIDGQRDTPGLVKPFPRAGVQHPRTLQPLLTMLEPVRLTGEEAKVANRSYIYATANLPSSFTRFHDQVRDDPAWTVHEIATGHMVMLEDPEGLAALLLGEAGR